jgi:hypothetical protein
MLEFKGRNRKLGSGIPSRNRKLELEKGAQLKNLKQVCRDLESSARNSEGRNDQGKECKRWNSQEHLREKDSEELRKKRSTETFEKADEKSGSPCITQLMKTPPPRCQVACCDAATSRPSSREPT